MRSLLFRSTAIAAVLMGGTFAAGTAFAAPYIPITDPVPPIPWDYPASPDRHPGKEFSTELDKDTLGNLDDQQNLKWGLNGSHDDTFDYNGVNGTSGNPSDQVDALAHPYDTLFNEVVANQTAILYSLRQDDPGTFNQQGSGSDVGGVAVYYETTLGVQDKWAVWPTNAISRNLDALEVWGPEGTDDAYRYSLFNDVAGANNGTAGGCSIYDYDGVGTSTCWLSQGELADIMISLFFSTANTADIDLDALMIYGDDIMFSLWPVLNAGIKGDEVWVWNRAAGNIAFLNHGGHLWNSGWTEAYYGQVYNVDALEAGANVPEIDATSGTSALTLLMGSLALLAERRRRSRVDSLA